MQSPNLLANAPTMGLSLENDLFGHLPKAQAIEYFLRNYEQDNVKMIALYGNWGSGKTTVMRYLENKLKEEFATIFFEAWRFEKDKNLALSLTTAISEKSATKAIGNAFKKSAVTLLKGTIKGITIKLPSIPKVQPLEIKFSGKDYVEEFEKAFKDEDKSEHQKEEDFKKKFDKLEESILGSKMKRLLVFVDDLDRCEPENIINLLSMLKQFFTLGTKVIFVCGVDKGAVSKAIRTKYGDVIKGEEYLEKIFDINFSMPETTNIEKLVEHYISSKIVYEEKENNHAVRKKAAEYIADLFKNLQFTNPRHVKKVMNKYELLQWYKYSSKLNGLQQK